MSGLSLIKILSIITAFQLLMLGLVLISKPNSKKKYHSLIFNHI